MICVLPGACLEYSQYISMDFIPLNLKMGPPYLTLAPALLMLVWVTELALQSSKLVPHPNNIWK